MPKSSLLPFAAAACALLALSGCSTASRVRSLNDKAYGLMYNNRPLDAIPLCKEAVRLAPNDAESHKNLGLAYADTAQFSLAEQESRTAIRLQPNYEKAYSNLGKALQGMGRYDEAFTAYREAIHLYPEYTVAHLNFAGALRESGRTGEAIAMYQKALQFDPGVTLTYIEFGELLHEQKRYKDAATMLSAGLSRNGQNAELHRLLGAVYRDTGDLAKALSEWEKTVSLDPESYMAHRSLADAYRKQSRLD